MIKSSQSGYRKIKNTMKILLKQSSIALSEAEALNIKFVAKSDEQ